MTEIAQDFIVATDTLRNHIGLLSTKSHIPFGEFQNMISSLSPYYDKYSSYDLKKKQEELIDKENGLSLAKDCVFKKSNHLKNLEGFNEFSREVISNFDSSNLSRDTKTEKKKICKQTHFNIIRKANDFAASEKTNLQEDIIKLEEHINTFENDIANLIAEIAAYKLFEKAYEDFKELMDQFSREAVLVIEGNSLKFNDGSDG